MKLSQSIKTFYGDLKANPRLRWGLLSVVGILWFYGILELRDEARRMSDSYLTLNKKISRIQGSARQSEWLERLKNAQSMEISLESRLWKEGTIGLAQATINDWLTQAAQQAALGKVQLSVAAQEDPAAGEKTQATAGEDSALPPFWKISAKLAFDFNPETFYPFLNRLKTNEKKIIVESLVIRSSPTPKTELLLATYFKKNLVDATAIGSTKNVQ